MKIQEIEGIGPAYAAKLQQASIATVGDLIEHAATRKGRDELAATTSIDRDLILEWVNHADLMRIKGVGPEYSDLLEAAGVDSPAELAQRNPAHLVITFEELNAARPTVRRLPNIAEVKAWIAEARTMAKVVEH